MEQVSMTIPPFITVPFPEGQRWNANSNTRLYIRNTKEENTLAGDPISYQEFWKKLGEFTAGKFQKFNASIAPKDPFFCSPYDITKELYADGMNELSNHSPTILKDTKEAIKIVCKKSFIGLSVTPKGERR